MFNTTRSQGRPIIYVSLALAAGFLALAFSNFAPTVQFGWLAAGVMLLAMVGELMLTPILMYSTRLVTLWDLVQTPDAPHHGPLGAAAAGAVAVGGAQGGVAGSPRLRADGRIRGTKG